MKSFNDQEDSEKSKMINTEMPAVLTTDNKFNIANGFFYGEFNDAGRFLFNFIYEFIERNMHAIYPLDIFKMEDFTNEQVKKVHSILNTAKFNVAIVAAQFASGTHYSELHFEVKVADDADIIYE